MTFKHRKEFQMRRRINLPLGAFIFVLSLIVVGIVGWIMNIVKLVGLAQASEPNYIMAGIRAIGIFLIPIGSVLGLFV